jgi:hypothetical protein
LILVLTVFGWTNGRAMVKTAYSKAKKHAGEERGSPQNAPSPARSVQS